MQSPPNPPPRPPARTVEPARVQAAPSPGTEPPRSYSPVGVAKINLQAPHGWGARLSAPSGPVFLGALLIVGVLVVVGYYVRSEIQGLRVQIDGRLQTIEVKFTSFEEISKRRDEFTNKRLGDIDYNIDKIAGSLNEKRITRLRYDDGSTPTVDAKPTPLASARTAPIEPASPLVAPPSLAGMR